MSLRRVPLPLPPGRLTHRSYASQTTPVTIGIRREDPGRKWERRVPLTPDAVAELVSHEKVRVLIQECERRVFPVDEYIRAGAEVHSTLAPAHLVLGIKETPLPSLVTSPVPSIKQDSLVPRTHMMFSHTIKGQEYNMPLLSRFLAGGDKYANPHLTGDGSLLRLEARLIDYELLTGADGKRTVAFGWHAGVAGTLEALVAMAQKHLERGVASPFLYTPRPHTSSSLDAHRAKLRHVGSQIVEHGTPKSLGPVIFGVTGNGNVTQGVLSILSELPIVKVGVQDLPALCSNPGTDLRKIYLVHALPESYISRNDGAPYDRSDYYANPHEYRSEFHTKIAPYLTLLVNGVGWNVGFPRLLTTSQLALAKRLAAIGDISCDIGGGLEFVSRATTIDAPSFDVNGVTVVAVDILPASLPRDASVHFSEKLFRYVRSVVNDYKGVKNEDVEASNALKGATIASHGRLEKRHEWLAPKVEAWRATQESRRPATSDMHSGVGGSGGRVAKRKKRVLVLGSGMVAGPAVDELAGRPDAEVIVASNSIQEAEHLVATHPNARALLINMDDKTQVSQLVKESDIVISLLPAPLHPAVAELCVEHKKHMVTASYVSPAMRSLHSRAQSAGVILLNEIGLDPGIDHCSAHSLLSRLRAENKRVVSFTSFCGGLPAPEAAEGVPLGYKFSWSPRGVLRAAGEGAKFLLSGQNWEIPGKSLLLQHFPDVPLSNVLKLEGLANRNSMHYAETYSLEGKELRTMLRGTLRYPGFASLMHSFGAIGLLESSKTIHLDRWSSLTRLALEQKLGISIPEGDAPTLSSAFSSVLPPSRVPALLEALNWLHLVPSASPAGSSVPVPQQALPPADALALHLAHALRYAPRERDLVLLHHEVVARDPWGGAERVYTSSLSAYGDARASAMARTVGLPVAFSALRVLDGSVRATGVCGPTADEAVWRGVLEGLEGKGLGFKESVGSGPSMEGVLSADLQRTTTASASF